MAVVLQISDLHRSASDPVRNAELLAALQSDQARWPSSVARGPDIVVVSGDLVQGVPLGVPDFESQLDLQWADAAAFVTDLADHFVGGDRSRVILVPGNHDVDWNTSRSAMELVPPEEVGKMAGGLPASVLNPTSRYRWDWSEQKLYRVADTDRYEQRLRRFLDFRREFYRGISPDPLRFGSDVVFFEYPALDLTIAGLSSWFGNDCYCLVGAFDPDMLASTQEAISVSACSLHVAVWHHSTAGAPAETDFLDVRLVHRLIDYGFRVGLYGHHHRTDAAIMTLKLPTEEEMALVSAGSLAAGRRELPAGVHRQYSLLEIRPTERRLRVHVREAISDLIFAASARTELGGEDHVDLGWSPSPRSPRVHGRIAAALDDAYGALANHDPKRAWGILRGLPEDEGPARRLRIEVLGALEDWKELTRVVDKPASQEELIVLVDALCRIDLCDSARASLAEHGDRLAVSRDIRAQLEARILKTEAAR